MQKSTTNKLTIAAVSIAAAASFGVGAAALAQGDVEFNPNNFASAYTQGSDGSSEGYRANPTAVDAEANRQSEDGEDADKTAGSKGIDDAFSNMPIDGQSGTTAYNLVGDASSGVLVSRGENAGGSAGGLVAGAPVIGGGTGGATGAGDAANNGNAGGANGAGDGNNGANGDVKKPYINPVPVDPEPTKTTTVMDGQKAVQVTGSNSLLVSATSDTVDPRGLIIAKDEMSEYPLYEGQKLDKWAIFCALETSFYYEGTSFVWNCTKEQMNSDSYSCFKIVGDIPETAPTGEFTFEVAYRFNDQGEWNYKTIVYKLEESKYFVSTPAGEDGSAGTVLYRGKTLTEGLYYWTAGALGTTENVPVTRIFRSWLDNGEVVDNPYTYESQPGRHVISPGNFVQLPESYDVSCVRAWLGDDLADLDAEAEGRRTHLNYLQTLTGISEDGSAFLSDASGKTTFAVLDGIQAVEIGLGGLSVDKLVLPSSVVRIDTSSPTMQVRDAYVVSSDNMVYASTSDGILTTKDGTKYCAIPSKLTSIDVPASVTGVDIPSNNSIHRITLHETDVDKLPKIDFDKLGTCTVVVDDNIFVDYIAKYYYALAGVERITVAKASNPDMPYHVNNGMIYSDSDLVRVIDAAQSSISLDVPHTVKTGAFQGCEGVGTIILPDEQSYVFEDGSLNENVSLIVCSTKDQQEYVTSRLNEIGAPKAKVALSDSNSEGYRWYTAADSEGNVQTTLLGAPTNLVEFDGTVLDDSGNKVEIYAIGPNTFSQCQQLRWVTLNESIKEIGASAFAGCQSLEGVLINSRDSIYAEAYVFRNCNSLRFVASNAPKGVFLTDELPNSCKMFCPDNDDDNDDWYDWRFLSFGGSPSVSSYAMIDVGGGARVLYGEGEINGVPDTPWLALASSAHLPSVAQLPSSTMIIHANAFANIADPYSINWDDLYNLQLIWGERTFYNESAGITLRYLGAFENSALQGDVHLIAPDEFGFTTGVTVLNSAFAGSAIESITFGQGSLNLQLGAFSECAQLKTVYVDSSYGTIENSVFADCPSLTDMYFSSSWPITLDTINCWGLGFLMTDASSADEEAQRLRFHVPEGAEQNYLEAWTYPYVGYDGQDSMFAAVYEELLFATFDEPTDYQVLSVMSERLTAVENDLRTMMGMETVEKTGLISISGSAEEGGCVFKETGGVQQLVSVYSEDEVIDLDKLIPDNVEYAQVSANAFKDCPNVKRIVSSGKVSGFDSGAFNGLGDIALVIPSLEAMPMLLQGDTWTPYVFGNSGNLSIEAPDAVKDTLLRNWTYQSVGIMDNPGTEDFEWSMKSFVFWWGYGQDMTQAKLDAKVNGLFASFENKLRAAMGVDLVDAEHYSDLKSYVDTKNYYDIDANESEGGGSLFPDFEPDYFSADAESASEGESSSELDAQSFGLDGSVKREKEGSSGLVDETASEELADS